MNLLKRKNLRLRDYDYSQEGCYFVTTCTQKKKLLFGIIENGHMALNDYGQIAKTNIDNLSNLYCNIFIDKYVIMPNHIHLLILIEDGQPQGLSLPRIIGAMKSLISINILSRYKNQKYIGKIFQRSYHDHIIRNDVDYQQICKYIETNPLKWELDDYYISCDE